MSQANVLTILDSIESGGIKGRTSGLTDLRSILRDIQRGEGIALLTRFPAAKVIDCLCRVLTSETSTYLKTLKTSTKSSTSAAATSRLTSCSSTLRLTIETTCSILKLKTVRSIIDYVQGNITSPNGDVCEPIALDLAKSLNQLLAYAPHVDHLSNSDWHHVASFCMAQFAASSPGESQARTGASQSRHPVSAHHDTSIASRALFRQLTVEYISAIKHLTASPTAPTLKLAKSVYQALGQFLSSTTTVSSAEIDAVIILRNCVLVTSVEAVALTRAHVCQMLDISRKYWTSKSSLMKEEILHLLVALLPILRAEMKTTTTDFSDPASAIAETIMQDQLSLPRTDSLQLTDLDLGTNLEGKAARRIQHAGIRLRDHKPRAEQQWMILETITVCASCANIELEDTQSEQATEDARPHKRIRKSSHMDDLLADLKSAVFAKQILALQLLTFQLDLGHVIDSCMEQILAAVLTAVTADEALVANWAFILAGSCAHRCKPRVSNNTAWIALWRVAHQNITTPSKSRAACYAMRSMMQHGLLPRDSMHGFIGDMQSSLESKGPAHCDDASCSLLTSVLMRTNATGTVDSSFAEKVLLWVSTRWSPETFEDGFDSAEATLPGLCDLLILIYESLHQLRPGCFVRHSSRRSTVVELYLFLVRQRPLYEYLLAGRTLPIDQHGVQSASILEGVPTSNTSSTPPSPTVNTLTELLTTHLQRSQNTWTEGKPRNGRQTFDVFLQKTCILSALAHHVCEHFLDQSDERRSQLEALLDTHLMSIIDTLRRSDDDGVAKRLLSRTMSACDISVASPEQISSAACPSTFALKVGVRLLPLLDTLSSSQGHRANDDGIEIDLPLNGTTASQIYDDMTSFNPLHGGLAPSVTNNEVGDDSEARVFAKLLACLPLNNDHTEWQAHAFITYVINSTPADFAAAHSALCALHSYGHRLSPRHLRSLLEHFSATLLRVYAYERSEAVTKCMLELMVHYSHELSDPVDKELYDLGLDLYEYYVVVALPNNALSPACQTMLATFLLGLWKQRPDYGRKEDLPSTRTTLFQLMRQSPVLVKYHLAQSLHEIFALYDVQTHDAVYDDLQNALPNDASSIEGIALRILILARLGANWPSLLRKSTYHIFESAGQVTQSILYAKAQLSWLSASLGLVDTRQLYRLFGSQLLYTWLQIHDLQDIPYAIFGYRTLVDLIEDNESEVVAQLVLENKVVQLDPYLSDCRKTFQELLALHIHKAVAYCIAQDVANAEKGVEAPCEARLRDLIGSKTSYVDLIQHDLSFVITQSFRSIQLDGGIEKTLEKRRHKDTAFDVLTAIKSMGASTSIVTNTMQPSFRSRSLMDQLERVCRRISIDPKNAFNAPRFTLIAGLLIEDMDVVLGATQICTIVQKLRLLVSLSPAVATKGYPLTMLLRALGSYVAMPGCEDDIYGLMSYLYQQGLPYFKTHMCDLLGLAVLTMLRLKTSHNGGTAVSGPEVNTPNMRFCIWLAEFLLGAKASVADPVRDRYCAIITACHAISFPAVVEYTRPAGKLLLSLLEDLHARDQLLSYVDSKMSITVLLQHSDAPNARSQDMFASAKIAERYAATFWEIASVAEPKMLAWAGKALGRSSQSTRRLDGVKASRIATEGLHDTANMIASEAAILANLQAMLSGSDRKETYIAEQTLRQIIARSTASTGLNLKHIIHPEILQVFDIAEGQAQVIGPSHLLRKDHEISQLQAARLCDLETSAWCKSLALMIVSQAQMHPILGALKALINEASAYAEDNLARIMHIGLLTDNIKGPKVKSLLTDIYRDVFASEQHSSTGQATCKILIQAIVYLLQNPLAEESVRTDRLKWLNIDYVSAAMAAMRCDMATNALYLLEYANPGLMTGETGSRRSSAGKTDGATLEVIESLLAEILRSLPDQDAFYGIQTSIGLSAVLSRVEHERDGNLALMLHAAAADATLRHGHIMPVEQTGIFDAVAMLDLDSVTLALAASDRSGTNSLKRSEKLIKACRRLNQWDISMPDIPDSSESPMFTVMGALHRAKSFEAVSVALDQAFTSISRTMTTCATMKTVTSLCTQDLGLLVQLEDLMRCRGTADFARGWQDLIKPRALQSDFSGGVDAMENHQAIATILRGNGAMLDEMQITPKDACRFEVEATLCTARVTQQNGHLQRSLTALNYIASMNAICDDVGLSVTNATEQATAATLCDLGEIGAAHKLLKSLCARKDLEKQSIPVGRAGLLAQLGHLAATARLEKPDDIIKNYLKPAISHVKKDTDQREAAQVYFEFASFCEKQLAVAKSDEDSRRLELRRNQKRLELGQLEELYRATAASKKQEKQEISRSLTRARNWYKIDDQEYQEVLAIRTTLVQQSLSNFLLAFKASDQHDEAVVRFFALWLEHSGTDTGNAVVAQHLGQVPSRKFIVLLNQLMSSLFDDRTLFQSALQDLIGRLCTDHPYHSLYHVFAACNVLVSQDDVAGKARTTAASKIAFAVRSHKSIGETLDRIWTANEMYHAVATAKLTVSKQTKLELRSLPAAYNMNKRVSELKLPPATISVVVRPDRNYAQLPVIIRFRTEISIASGLSAPKILTAIASDGQQYKQLFKGGNDDLRQDAIMEQVFGEVSKMLRKHKATHMRDLHIRTYKVLPVSSASGIIEFVPHSMPLNDVLVPLHQRYHPKDITNGKAREMIQDAKEATKDQRVSVFRNVLKKYQPVLRHFFFERFQEPDEWFQRRLAYTRSTAAISILGHVLGLGDRHCHNILLDENSGEAIHIDLGVAFETGRILPMPELVPFRLTRDIVDGMGITKTEGVFRRCCEFTLEALREEKDGIMTILNVLRYDPLYSWTISPLRARRLQNDGAEDPSRPGSTNGSGAPRTALQMQTSRDEASEAERALATVEKKLAKTLSVQAVVNELIQQATDERNLAVLFAGWAAYS